jgi:two-component system nitrate/nitrite response regulator NarL
MTQGHDARVMDEPTAPRSSSAGSIHVVLVVEVRLYREGLAAALPNAGVTLAGTASNRSDARASVQKLQPDAVVVDVGMPEAFELMRELRADIPDARLIAFGVDEDVSAVIRCAEAGAAGYVTVNGGIDDLVGAIEHAVDGQLLCSPRIAAALFSRVGDRSRQVLAPDVDAALTSREHQVLTLLRQRLSNKEIAVTLNISEPTVKNHVHNLLEKLHVASRTQAASYLPSRMRPAVGRANGGRR